MILNKYRECLDFLYKNNFSNINYFKSNLLNYLISTFNLLKKWKQHEDLCFSGMFNNVYKYIDVNLNREIIKKLIGEKSEELVFKFNNLKKEDIYSNEDKDIVILASASNYSQSPILSTIDNIYDSNYSKDIEKYFLNLPWFFDGRNITDLSKKWDYYLSFKNIYEKELLELNKYILKKHGLLNLYKLNRAYASANSYGFCGEYHTDDDAKEYNEVVTIMYYLNNTWNLDFGGETFFLNESKDDILLAVSPKPARAVIFDGFISHGPRPLSKLCNELRMVLTFKYRLINET
jgi:hypothetical protein